MSSSSLHISRSSIYSDEMRVRAKRGVLQAHAKCTRAGGTSALGCPNNGCGRASTCVPILEKRCAMCVLRTHTHATRVSRSADCTRVKRGLQLCLNLLYRFNPSPDNSAYLNDLDFCLRLKTKMEMLTHSFFCQVKASVIFQTPSAALNHIRGINIKDIL